jgi:hypothetical protein
VEADLNGNVFVSEVGNHRISKFRENGQFLMTFGSRGIAPGTFEQPVGLSMTPSGNLLVADSKNDRIQEFSPSGSFVRLFGGYGTGNAQFDTPTSVVADGGTGIFVADTFNDRVQKFSASSAPTAVGDEPLVPLPRLAGFPNPFPARTRIAFEIPERGTAALAVYDAQGALVRSFPEVDGLGAGSHELTWDGTTNEGRTVGAGVYFLTLDTSAGRSLTKLIRSR